MKVWHYRRVVQSISDAEEPDLAAVRQLVSPGTIAVDLGANIGFYTKALSDLVGPTGQVFSVEPVPQTFAILSRNVRGLRMTNVTCLNVAVDVKAGEVVMNIPEYESGGLDYYRAQIVSDDSQYKSAPGRQVRVKTATLDSIVSGGKSVSFVKADVEGNELKMLAGGEMVLKKHRPIWLVEVWGNPAEGGPAGRLFQVFEDVSYSAWSFNGRKLTPWIKGHHSGNCFFLQSSHVASITTRQNSLIEAE